MMRDRFIDEPERARSALWSLDPDCSREEWVKYGMAAKAAGLDFEDFHQWSAGAGNFNGEQECRAVWRSFKTEGGISAASLFRAARDAGWVEGTEPRAIPPQSRPIEPTQAKPRTPPPINPASIWNACEPATAAHEYIARKMGLPDGLRVYSGSRVIDGSACDGALVLPMLTLSGELASLQFVTGNGKKFLPGRLPAGGCLIIGGPITTKPVYLVEGIAHAWSAHQATGCPAVVCFGWARVAKVAEALRAKYQAAKLVIVPDTGKEEQAAAIARHVRAAWVELPEGSPNNYDLNDYHRERGLNEVAALLQLTKEAPQRYRLLTPAEIADLPPVEWRIRGVLPSTGIAALFGPSGSGKSFLALDMLAASAGGRDWFGCRVTPCPVLYVGLEGEAGIAQRIKAHQMKNEPLPDAFRFMLQALDIRKPADCADLVSAARAAGCLDGVLCIDTLNRAAPGADENDSAAMGEIIAAAKSLQSELGGLVLLIHHTGKDQSKGLRGHSSLHAALDAAIAVTRDGDRREWVTAKAKDGADDQGHPFRLDVVELDTDEEGEPITSCVVIPEERAGDAMRRALPPKSGNQRIIWEALGDTFRAAGSYAPEGAPGELPAGRPCIRLEDAIAATRGRLVCDSKRQTERTQAAITGLINRGLIEHREGWLWCA